jgi:hypothetical protein
VAKTIRHLGMTLSEKEHREWHQRHAGRGGMKLSADEHDKLMGSLGIGKEEDETWHKRQPGRGGLVEASDSDTRVNIFAIGGGFIAHCAARGWLTKSGDGRAARYHVTAQGRKALLRFGIKKY